MLGEELTLRFPEPRDAETVFAAVRESINELHRWMPWCRMSFSLDDAAGWISAQASARESATAFEFVIIGTQGRLLGCCGINQIKNEHPMANLGYWVRSSKTGCGVATRAVKQAAGWAFAQTGIERLEIVAAVGNTARNAVAAKAGAVREGVLRSRLRIHGQLHDAVVFSLIRT